jgi:uncharacterized protein
VWLVSAKTPPELAYGMVRALWHPDALRMLEASVPASGGRLRVKRALRGIPIPLHGGAERFYRDGGYLEDLPESRHSAK